jgi:ABC-type branched-subunit amino acid transport system substrate-binding protein
MQHWSVTHKSKTEAEFKMKKISFILLFYISQFCRINSASDTPQPAPIQPQPNATIQTPMVSGKYEVQVGTSLPLTGDMAIIGQDILDGIQMYFNKMRSMQPPLNFFINFAAPDDNAAVAKFCENIDQLKQKSPIFTSFFGTEITKYSLPYLKNNSIFSFFPIEGSEIIRSEKLSNQIFLRATHKDELKALIHFLVKKLNKKKIAIFYEEGDWGFDLLESAKQVLAEYKLKPVKTDYYPQKSVNIGNAVKSIAEARPAVVLCLAQSRPTYNFVCQMINKGLHKTIFAGISNLFPIQKTLTDARGITVLLSSVVPDPNRSGFAIAKDFRNDLQKYLPNKKNISPFLFEGYINAAILCALIQATGFPLITEKFLNTIENLTKFKLATSDFKNDKNLTFKFDKKTKTLLRGKVWINTGDNKRWKLEKGI